MKQNTIIITPLLEAKATFDRALERVDINNELERDGCIQRFEYCYELAWKMLKRFLKAKEIEVHGSRETFREAAVVGYISDPEKWFDFIEMRNLTVHTYNVDVAKKIFEELDDFQKALNELVTNLQKHG